MSRKRRHQPIQFLFLKRFSYRMGRLRGSAKSLFKFKKRSRAINTVYANGACLSCGCYDKVRQLCLLDYHSVPNPYHSNFCPRQPEKRPRSRFKRLMDQIKVFLNRWA